MAPAAGRNVDVERVTGCGFRNLGVMVLFAQLAPHLPAHPQQQDAAGKQQADDLQQLDRDAGKADAHHGRRGDAPEDHLGALVLRQTGGGEPDDDGVVAGQHQVDHDDLEQRGKSFGREVCTHVRSQSLS